MAGVIGNQIMYIQKNLITLFHEFCKVTGDSEIKELTSTRSPDIMFEWRGDAFWGYKKSGGYEIFGEDTDEIEDMWSQTLEKLVKEQVIVPKGSKN